MRVNSKIFAIKSTAALCILAVATLAVYWQVLDNQFVIYDDTDYVTENGSVLAGLTWNSIAWAFTTGHAGNWHPLTWISHMLDVTMYGIEPRGHHLTNLLLHTANVLLLFTLLKRMTGAFWRSLSVALIFALHPIHVESVAWVSERKDVLSTFFFIITLIAYHRYTLRPGIARYSLILLAFAAGLMAKQMLVSLPIVLLLLDYWPLYRLHERGGNGTIAVLSLRGPILEKLPLVLMSICAAVITFITHQQVGTVQPITANSILVNIANAIVASSSYIVKMFLPLRLAVYYPPPPHFPPFGTVAGAILLIGGIATAAVLWRKHIPYVTTGWFWFLITLLPVSGIVHIGSTSMADRYTYIPLIGPYFALVWGSAALATKWRWGKPVIVTLGCCFLITLSLVTVRQCRHWFNSITLFSHAVAVTKNNYLAYNNLGVAYCLKGGMASKLNIIQSFHTSDSVENKEEREIFQQQGIAAFRKAVQIQQDFESPHYNLALAFLKRGDRDAAAAELRILHTLNQDQKHIHELEAGIAKWDAENSKP